MALTEAAPGRGRVPQRTPAGTLWRNGDFLKFWAGESVSLLGTQVTVLALPLTAVITLHSGPETLGLLRFFEMVPFLLFGLLFGVLADRMRRRPLMLASNAIRLVLVASVPVLAATGHLVLGLLYVVAFGVGSAAVVFDVCWLSYVPALVRDKALLVDANSKLGTTAAGADAAGPGIAGVLVSALTAPIAMAVDAASYAVSLISLLLIRTPEPRVARPVRGHLRSDLREGLAFILHNRYLRAVALVAAMCNFFTTATQSMFILYAVQDHGLSPGALGVILSVGAVGGIVGAAAAGPLIRRLAARSRLRWLADPGVLRPGSDPGCQRFEGLGERDVHRVAVSRLRRRECRQRDHHESSPDGHAASVDGSDERCHANVDDRHGRARRAGGRLRGWSRGRPRGVVGRGRRICSGRRAGADVPRPTTSRDAAGSRGGG